MDEGTAFADRRAIRAEEAREALVDGHADVVRSVSSDSAGITSEATSS
jgi:hypothetical protein